MSTGQKISAMTAATAFASGDIIPIVSGGANEGLDHDVLMADPQIVQAWGNFTTVTTTALRDSYNIESLTDNGTGNTTVTFTSAMEDTNYCIVLGGGDVAGGTVTILTITAKSTTAFTVQCENTIPADRDRDQVSFAVLGGV